MNAPEVWRAQELADILGCAVTTVEERARRRELPGLKFGDGGWIFPREATVQVLNDLAMDYYMSDTPQTHVSVPLTKRKPPALPTI